MNDDEQNEGIPADMARWCISACVVILLGLGAQAIIDPRDGEDAYGLYESLGWIGGGIIVAVWCVRDEWRRWRDR